MQEKRGFTIQTRDGLTHGPYNLRVVKAFIVAGKFTYSDRVVSPSGATTTLARLDELADFWGKQQQKQQQRQSIRPTGGHQRIAHPTGGMGTIPKVPTKPTARVARRTTGVPGRVVFYRGKVLPPGPNPNYAGNLEKNSPLKMMYSLYLAGKTGRMHFRSGRHTVDVFFEYGQPAYAVSERNETRLGELLVNQHLISRETLTEVLQVAKKKNRPLGQVLLERKSVSAGDIKTAFLEQLKQRLFEVFEWRKGIYRFYEGQVTGCSFPTEPNPFLLMAEGALKHTPQSVVVDSLMQHRSRRVARLLHPKISIEDFQLSPEQLKFYEHISNQDPLNDLCGSAVEQGILSEGDALRVVYLLWQVDLLKMGEELMGTRTQKQIEELQKLAKRLEKQTRLERLGLDGGASEREIRNVYLKLAKRYHPDQLPPGSHSEVTKSVEEVFALIADAYRTLT